jgi:beta-glucanase (GH16 family)
MGLSTGYHLYGVAWDATGYKFYVDNQLTRTYALADSVDVNGVNCIFSSEVRDNANIGSIPSGGYGSQSSSTVKMNVDYVRSYQVVPEPATCTLLGSAAISLLGYAWQHCRTYRRHRDARTD